MFSDVIMLLSGNDDGWLSTREAAGRLDLNPRALFRLIDSGQLPAHRFGRVLRVQAVDIDDYITANRIEPGTLGYLYDVSTDHDTDDDTDE